MDYFLLFIGLLTLSALGYTIYKLNNKSEPIDDPQKRLDAVSYTHLTLPTILLV